MNNRKKKQKQYLLNDVQIDALMVSHERIIKEILIEIGIEPRDREIFLTNGSVTFEKMIIETQERLKAKEEKAEIKKEILLDTI